VRGRETGAQPKCRFCYFLGDFRPDSGFSVHDHPKSPPATPGKHQFAQTPANTVVPHTPNRVRTRNAAIRTRNAIVRTRNAAIRTRNAVVRTRNAAIRTRNAAVRTRNAAIRTRNAVVRTRNAAIRTRNAVVRTRNAAIRTRNAIVGTRPAIRRTPILLIRTANAIVRTSIALVRSAKVTGEPAPASDRKSSAPDGFPKTGFRCGWTPVRLEPVCRIGWRWPARDRAAPGRVSHSSGC